MNHLCLVGWYGFDTLVPSSLLRVGEVVLVGVFRALHRPVPDFADSIGCVFC
jgi:hypothetical protein